MEECKWPRISDLHEDERVPFALWLCGQIVPWLEGEPVESQDAFYPWDYERWKKGR